MGGIHAVEHAALSLFPLFALCDRFDVAGISYTRHRSSARPPSSSTTATPAASDSPRASSSASRPLLEATLELISRLRLRERLSGVRALAALRQRQPADRQGGRRAGAGAAARPGAPPGAAAETPTSTLPAPPAGAGRGRAPSPGLAVLRPRDPAQRGRRRRLAQRPPDAGRARRASGTVRPRRFETLPRGRRRSACSIASARPIWWSASTYAASTTRCCAATPIATSGAAHLRPARRDPRAPGLPRLAGSPRRGDPRYGQERRRTPVARVVEAGPRRRRSRSTAGRTWRCCAISFEHARTQGTCCSGPAAASGCALPVRYEPCEIIAALGASQPRLELS